MVDAHTIVDIESPRFKRSNRRQLRAARVLSLASISLQFVNSAVYVFGGEAAASRDFDIMRSPRAWTCMERELTKPYVSQTRSGPFAPPARKKVSIERLLGNARLEVLPGLAGLNTYGRRTSGELETGLFPGQGSQFIHDSVSFVVGRAVVVLDAGGVRDPFPAGTERRLVALLYNRAKAHRL